MPLTAIVVGAGIGGLATAIALRRADFDVTILERRPSTGEAGYAIDIPPNALRILRYFGMDTAKFRGVLQTALEVYKAGEEPMTLLASEDRNIGKDDPFISVHRVDYHEALKDYALGEDAPGRPAVLRCNSNVVEYDSAAGTVLLDSRDSYKADLVVAADGNSSKAHKWVLGQDAPAHFTGLNNVRFIVPTDVMMQDEGMKHLVKRTKDKMSVYIDSGGDFVTQYSCRDHTLQNFGLYQQDKVGIDPSIKDKKKDLAQERLSRVNDTFRKIAGFIEEDGAFLWQIVDRDPLEKMHNGRLVLIGDASHPMQPKLGQGAAQAVEDAAVLGLVLEGMNSTTDIAPRLKLWEELRRPRASAIQLMSRTDPSHEGWPDPEDGRKAAEFFPPGELPSSRSAMTAWAFKYNAVAEARALFDKRFRTDAEESTNGSMNDSATVLPSQVSASS